MLTRMSVLVDSYKLVVTNSSFFALKRLDQLGACGLAGIVLTTWGNA